MKRVLTAVALIPLIVYVILWGPGWLFLGVVAVVAILCYSEYAGIVRAYHLATFGPVGYAAGLGLLAASQETLLLVVLLALLGLALALRSTDLAQSLPGAAAFLLGIVYIFGPWKSAILLHNANPHLLMYAVALNWIADTAAYWVGRSWARHPMAPRISPKKSWEGAAASVLAAVLFGYLYLGRAVPALPVWRVIAISAVANVVGQLGDLCESALKRGAGLKDSGRLLPGHGGWLDRLDSTLFSLPAIYLWLRFT